MPPTPPSSPDPSALPELLARHVPLLRAFLRLRMSRQLRSLEESSDLVQTVCRELLDHRDGFAFRGDAEFRAWLCTAALNKLRERERFWTAEKRDPQRKKELVTEDHALAACYASVLTPSRAAIGKESLERFERAFEELSEQQREVVILVRLSGLSHAQAAEQLGTTEVATRSLLHRALVRLTTLLSEPRDSRP